MFTSTFLTLLVIPVAYLVLDDAVERSQILMRWFRAARSRNGLVETLQKLIPGGK